MQKTIPFGSNMHTYQQGVLSNFMARSNLLISSVLQGLTNP